MLTRLQVYLLIALAPAILNIAPEHCYSDQPSYLGNHRRAVVDPERFCAAYATWHVLRLFGRHLSLEDIITHMKLQERGYADITDIVMILESAGLNAEAVKLDVSDIDKLNVAFIPFIPPQGHRTLGHFVVCVPTNGGRAIVLDGGRDPYDIQLEAVKANGLRAGWNGNAILVRDRDCHSNTWRYVTLIWVASIIAYTFASRRTSKAKGIRNT